MNGNGGKIMGEWNIDIKYRNQSGESGTISDMNRKEFDNFISDQIKIGGHFVMDVHMEYTS